MMKSDQVTLMESTKMGDDVFPADCGGVVRSCYFSYTQKEDAEKGEVIHLAILNVGSIRIHGKLSSLETKGKFSLGYGDYTDEKGKQAKGDPEGFDKTIKAGKLLSALPMNTKYMKTQTGVNVIAVATAEIKKGTTVEGVIYFTNT